MSALSTPHHRGPWWPPSPGSLRRAAAAAVAAVVVAGCTGSPGRPPTTGPATGPTTGPTTQAPVSPTVTPEATPAPSGTGSATEPPTAGRRDAPVLRVGGAVGDHPVDAPEPQVVADLTHRFGAEPRVEGDGVACETSGLPGRRLVWDGLTVLVRTTDESDATTAPYVAGWHVDERGATSPLGPFRTAEGIGLGDSEDAVAAAYPQGRRFDAPELGMSLWAVGSATGDHTDDLVVRMVDGVVTAMGGGFGCGD